MAKAERAIILAAGRGHQLDGFTKILLRHPKNGKTVLDHAVEAFSDRHLTVVVGFRAIQVMEAYPRLNYVINHDWAVTNNAHSLALALDDTPSFVVSGDTFFNRDLVDEMEGGPENLALTERRENRTLSAVHCDLDEENRIRSTYQGPMRSAQDPEALGMFKITDVGMLRRWKRQSIEHGNLFVGQTLPCDGCDVMSFDRKQHVYDEINTPADYQRLIETSL